MTGTESGRFSYADPPIHSWPDEIRHLVHNPDTTIISADYRAIEARVFALLTNDRIDLEVFRRFDANPEDKEWDIHYRTACDLFGYSIGGLLSQPSEQAKGARLYAKNFRYGVLLYGGGPTSTKAKVGCPCPKCVDKAPPTVSVTPRERKLHADRWFQRHQCAQIWRDQISQQVMRQHFLRGPMNQKWYFHKPWGTDVQREAWNRAIQGTAATIINRAMRALDVLQCPLILQHHDALVAEAPHGEADKWAIGMKSVMELPVGELQKSVFPITIEIGDSWGNLREWKT